MFRLSYTTKADVQGTIVFDHQPWTLGYHKDIEGRLWDIQGYYGLKDKRAWVQACLVKDLHKGLTDTSGFYCGFINQTWMPYWVEVKNDERNI